MKDQNVESEEFKIEDVNFQPEPRTFDDDEENE
jgi:hypothetical protein